MAFFRSLIKPSILEKRTKKLIQRQSNHYLTINCNGKKHRVVYKKVRKVFKGQISLPNTGY
ncbi:Putative 60S ribosomal protein L32' [Lemmus lemmus]